MDLHRAAVPLDFASMTPSRRLLTLPAYPWDRRRWWHEASDWREGRTGPAGRGFLDFRLPRATPTWSVHLDGRQMAFLKDHRVENMVMFPAAAFVEMVLEAGVQVFEGRPFVVEDFEIRKPLILPDPVSGVLLELSYDPAERTFVIQSKFEQGATWSVHVVGAMRGERTESPFVSSTWEGVAAGGQNVPVDEFYQHMSDRGLRYGEEFRPIRELAAGDGKSAGRVALTEAVSGRVNEYALHPVLFDGALQVFSAGAATVEDRKAGMKLPVRFARILYLGSPGAATFVRASVIECNDQFVEGRIGLYDAAGTPCVLVDGFRAISVAGARRSGAAGGTRNVLYHSAWERAAGSSRPGAEPLPLARLHEAATLAINQVLDTRGRAALEAAMKEGDELAAAQLARGLRDMAMFAEAGSKFSAKSLRVSELMLPAFERLTANLARRGLLKKSRGGYAPTAAFASAADSASRRSARVHPSSPRTSRRRSALCVELRRAGPDSAGRKGRGAGALCRHRRGTAGSILRRGALYEPLARRDRGCRAGSGPAPARGARIAHSRGRRGHGRARRARLAVARSAGCISTPSATFRRCSFPRPRRSWRVSRTWNSNSSTWKNPAREQGFDADSFDLIIGTNVLHAVSDLRSALRSLHALLAPGGSLVFMDVANPQLWTDAVFGLTAGWWRFTDRDLRPLHPLLGRAQWETVLRETGFAETASIPGLPGSRGRRPDRFARAERLERGTERSRACGRAGGTRRERPGSSVRILPRGLAMP